ncbi:MAG TPA: hypothetical protein VFC79_12820, partial [Tissierellaceae bacterium]|nr:hypothetical protein [Tissierellaceae bacterium]
MSLNNFVLFSPIGTSDPVRGGFDGSMLHIVRHYCPKKVYLYYSKSMHERDFIDNKSESAIKYIDNDIVVEKFTGESKPYDFDSFIEEFNRIVNIIALQNEGMEILFNISSGTPQMKSTLCLEAVTSNKHIKVVQVLTPVKGPNIDEPELGKNRDIEDIMENNLDSLDEAENRCIEPQIMSFRHSMIKSQIKSLIDIYDYEGAIRLTESFRNEKLISLINHCRLRINLENKEALKEINEYKSIRLFPIAESSISRLVEYFLTLKLRQKKGQLTDMVIALNPFIIELMREYLKIVIKVDLEYCYEKNRKSGEIYINSERIMGKDKYFHDHLNKSFRGGFRESSSISIDFLDEAILFYSDKNLLEDVEFFNKIRKLNQVLRNTSAHSLDAVNDEDILKVSGMTSSRIINRTEGIIKRMFGNKIDSRIFDIYDEING